MLGTLLDLLAGVVILLSLLWFAWLGFAGVVSPRLVGGRSRLGLLGGSVFGCAVSLYLMTAIREAEPEPAVVSAPAPAPAPAPPDTEWIVESGVAAAAGERERLRLGVTCRGDRWIIALDKVSDRGGGPVEAHWSWDNQPFVDYIMISQHAAGLSTLTTFRNWRAAAEIVELLRTRSVVGLRVETVDVGYERGEVWDSFGLADAAAALDSLTCEEQRAPPPRRGASFSTDTAAGIFATLVQPYIGDPVESVLGAMTDYGYEPTRSRTGERRLFTYRFDDGSGLVLVFVPPDAPGTGLVLDDIIVR